MSEAKGEARNFERFYVPQCEHHLLIGKGGETMRHLQATHPVRIRVPRLEEKSDAITVQSTAQGEHQKVLNEICKEFERILGFAVGTSPLLTVKLDIPPGKYGLLIGAKGVTLKDIQTKSGAVLSIPKKDDQTPNSKVTATGSKAALGKLLSEVTFHLGFRPTVIGEPIDSEDAASSRAVVLSGVACGKGECLALDGLICTQPKSKSSGWPACGMPEKETSRRRTRNK